MNATPHVAQNTNGRSSTIDGRTTCHPGYALSQHIRKRIDEAFGWVKIIAGHDRTKFRGRERVEGAVHLRRRRLQSGAVAEAPRSFRVKAPANCRLIDWRIIETHLDLRDLRG
jgi:hypothetical protein